MAASAALPVVTTGERSIFKRCPQRWFWQFRMGLTPRAVDTGALWFGIGVHEALAQWYGKGTRRSRVKPADYFVNWVGEELSWVRTTNPDEEGIDQVVYQDASELGYDMLEGYVREWGRDANWKVIAVESQFSVKVTRDGHEIAIFKSTYDLVYLDLDTDEIYLGEHKTASQIQTTYLELDDQAGIYWASAGPILRHRGVLKPNQQIKGIQYNYLRKAKRDERPVNELGQSLNKNGDVSKQQPAPRYVRPDPVERTPREQKTQFERLSSEVEAMNLMREGKLKPWKTTQKDCTFCPFFQMCKLHEHGGNGWKEIARASFTVEDPYDRYSLMKSAA